jgi:FMN-dependent NADH-azoreductase
MERLLYIESSPRKDRSESIRVANEFLDEYWRTHPKDHVEIFNLWREVLPAFDGDVINAKYRIMSGEARSTPERAAWQPVEQLINHFTGFDKYLFSIPMWNFGIPYILKHYLDLLVQPGHTFSFTPEEGYKGLVTGKPVVVVYARGGSYEPLTPMERLDHQKGYMETVLGFIGFTDIRSIVVEPTISSGRHEFAKMIEIKKHEARSIAAVF